jgi:hypothetical protein
VRAPRPMARSGRAGGSGSLAAALIAKAYRRSLIVEASAESWNSHQRSGVWLELCGKLGDDGMR